MKKNNPAAAAIPAAAMMTPSLAPLPPVSACTVVFAAAIGTTLEAGAAIDAGGASDLGGGPDDGPIDEGGAEMLAGASETLMLGGAALIAAARADSDDTDGGELSGLPLRGVLSAGTLGTDGRTEGKGVALGATEEGGGVLETRSASSFRLGLAAR